MGDKIQRMTVAEFRELGYLQELNRQFLHPLGLALEVIIEEDGSERFGEVWDYRDDPEGLCYGALSEDDMERGQAIEELQRVTAKTRKAALGFVVQPLEVV